MYMAQYTAKDIIEFLEGQDCYNNSFKNWSRKQLMIQLSESIINGSFAWIADEHSIIGVCLGKPDLSTNTMHIVSLNAIDRETVARLIHYFWNKFSGWTLTGKRHGKLHHYDENAIKRMYRMMHIHKGFAIYE